MINQLHKLMHQPRRGWDPVGAAYARDYAATQTVDPLVAAQFRAAIGAFSGKRVLDLGAGAGQYAAEFASAGADVTCLDISRAYLDIARTSCDARGVRCRYVLGYLEDAFTLTGGGFDAIFCNICWYYGVSDGRLARSVARSLAPGGTLFVRTHTNTRAGAEGRARLWRRVYDRFGYKVGHLLPPPGRVAAACRSAGLEVIEARDEADGIELTIARRRALA